MSGLVNPHVAPHDVPAPHGDALAFHRALPGYAPTPLRALPGLADELGLGAIALKDESDRLGLPAFKILGASWAVERLLGERAAAGEDVQTLVAASAGNHGRAVARAAADGRRPGSVELADVGDCGPAHWVIDGYATLFAELALQGGADIVLVSIGVGSLGAAAARFGAATGTHVIGVEPDTAACLTASLRDGTPTLAALRALVTDPSCAALRDAVACGCRARVVLIATEGPTDPDGYRTTVGAPPCGML